MSGEFTVYARFVFDAGRFGALARRPLSQLSGANFKELLRVEFSVPVTDISQRMTFARFPGDVARAVGIGARTVGGIMEVIGRSASGEMVYYQQIFVPPTARKLVTQPA